MRLVYANGSESGYEGKTIFDYIVTNTLRDGRASEGYWDTSRLPQVVTHCGSSLKTSPATERLGMFLS